MPLFLELEGGLVPHMLREGVRTRLFLTEDRIAITDNIDEENSLDKGSPVACITLAGWAARLEAFAQVYIRPANPHLDLDTVPHQEQYTLNKPDAIVLRAGDTLSFPQIGTGTSLTLKYKHTEVQVNSSLADAETERKEAVADVGAEDEDDETEDDDLDRTITVVTTNPLEHATPLPIHPKADIIQETPTIERSHQVIEEGPVEKAMRENTLDGTSMPTKDDEESATKNETPKSMKVDDITASNEIMHSSNETPHSSVDHDDNTPPSVPPSKRTTRTSPMVIIAAAKAGTKRKSSVLKETASPESTPTRSKRGKKEKKSQSDLGVERTPDLSGSSIGDSDELWNDDPPMVAFSNSTLPERAQLTKFLRQHGGSTVEVVEQGKCNLLCVKEGPIRKSMKLLSCIALGIPIVTDKWLNQSARKRRLLDPKAFMPKIPDQELEWNFSLASVWGKPQPNILKGLTVYFSPTLKKVYSDFKEVEAVCKLVGARRVESQAAGKVKSDKNSIFLAEDWKPSNKTTSKDGDCKILLDKGYTVYSRDLLTSSILRGNLDLESDEFKIKGPVAKKK